MRFSFDFQQQEQVEQHVNLPVDGIMAVMRKERVIGFINTIRRRQGETFFMDSGWEPNVKAIWDYKGLMIVKSNPETGVQDVSEYQYGVYYQAETEPLFSYMKFLAEKMGY